MTDKEEKKIQVEEPARIDGVDMRQLEGDLMSIGEGRKRVRAFKDFMETSKNVEKEVGNKLVTMTKFSDRQRDMVMEPIVKFNEELRERFEEIGCAELLGKAMGRLKQEKSDFQEICLQENEKAQKAMEEAMSEIAMLREENRVLEEELKKGKKAFSEEKLVAEGMKRNIQLLQIELEKLSCEKERGEFQADLWNREEQREPRREKSRRKEGGRMRDRSAGWRNRERDEESYLSRRSVEEEWVQSMSRMMKSSAKASALPTPKEFDGTGEFSEFKRAFLLKYQSVTDGDDELVTILEEQFLKGAAKTIFKTLPRRFERTIRDLFEEFEKKLRKRQGDARSEALTVFELMQRKSGQKMWEYCTELEKWSKKALGDVSEETLSQLRVTKLLRAVQEDSTLYKLLTMKRVEVPFEEQYEQLKDVVLQQENQERCYDDYKKQEQEKDEGKKIGGKKDFGKENRRDRSHGKEDTSDSGFKGESRSMNGMKCYKCGGVGHFARECTSKPVQGVIVENSVLGEGVGAEIVEIAEVLGQKRKIVIDSGSVVSVMSSGLWERLKKGYPEWKQQVEILEKPGLTLLDASKRKMTVKGQIRTKTKVRGREAEVTFQLVENQLDVFLLGTNAFKSMRVEVKWKAKKSVAQVDEKQRVQPQSGAQIAVEVEADSGKSVLLESGEERVPTSLCSGNESGKLTALVSKWRSEPLLIKKNQMIGVVNREELVPEKQISKGRDEPLLIKKNQMMGVVNREKKLASEKQHMANMMELNKKEPSKGDVRTKEVLGILKEKDSELGQKECEIELEKSERIRQKCRLEPMALQKKVKVRLKSTSSQETVEMRGDQEQVRMEIDRGINAVSVVKESERKKSSWCEALAKWKGPCRVVETTYNSAKVQLIGGDEKLRVPWEQVRGRRRGNVNKVDMVEQSGKKQAHPVRGPDCERRGKLPKAKPHPTPPWPEDFHVASRCPAIHCRPFDRGRI